MIRSTGIGIDTGIDTITVATDRMIMLFRHRHRRVALKASSGTYSIEY